LTYASPAFAGCGSCSVETEVEISGGMRSKVWFIGWRADSKNWVELLGKEDRDRWILRQRKNGTIVAKSKVQYGFLPNRKYQLRIAFNGTEFTAFIDGIPVIVMTPAAGTVPYGTVGFQVRGTTAHYSYVTVQ
ncbi:MAG TPA: hypothetical protein VLR94_05960, partial [Acidobacteriota bacterium]|nr:hypothetical protein [Acidobacteriota bacterium]